MSGSNDSLWQEAFVLACEGAALRWYLSRQTLQGMFTARHKAWQKETAAFLECTGADPGAAKSLKELSPMRPPPHCTESRSERLVRQVDFMLEWAAVHADNRPGPLACLSQLESGAVGEAVVELLRQDEANTAKATATRLLRSVLRWKLDTLSPRVLFDPSDDCELLAQRYAELTNGCANAVELAQLAAEARRAERGELVAEDLERFCASVAGLLEQPDA